MRRYGKLCRDFDDQPEDVFIRSSESVDTIYLIVAGASNAAVSTACPTFTIGRARDVTREIRRSPRQ